MHDPQTPQTAIWTCASWHEAYLEMVRALERGDTFWNEHLPVQPLNAPIPTRQQRCDLSHVNRRARIRQFGAHSADTPSAQRPSRHYQGTSHD